MRKSNMNVFTLGLWEILWWGLNHFDQFSYTTNDEIDLGVNINLTSSRVCLYFLVDDMVAGLFHLDISFFFVF